MPSHERDGSGLDKTGRDRTAGQEGTREGGGELTLRGRAGERLRSEGQGGRVAGGMVGLREGPGPGGAGEPCNSGRQAGHILVANGTRKGARWQHWHGPGIKGNGIRHGGRKRTSGAQMVWECLGAGFRHSHN